MSPRKWSPLPEIQATVQWITNTVSSNAEDVRRGWWWRRRWACFQREGVRVHTALGSRNCLTTKFLGGIISLFGDTVWPARSPHLSEPDYIFCADTLKLKRTQTNLERWDSGKNTPETKLEPLKNISCDKLLFLSEHNYRTVLHYREISCVMYKVVQIWPWQTVTCLHTNCPGHIWTTL